MGQISSIISENVRQTEKAGFPVAIVQTLVNYFLRFLAESDHADLAFKTTRRTWGQLFRLPNPFLVQKIKSHKLGDFLKLFGRTPRNPRF